MNILRVISSMDPASGGPCQGIRNSIPELGKIGINNEVVCFNDSNDSFLTKDKFTIHAIGRAAGPWAYNKQLIPWLLGNFHRFDIVIVHGLWLYHTYAVKKALKIYSKQKKSGALPKLLVMPHGMLDPYFQKAEGRKLKALRNWLYWKLIEGKVINDADGILFTCEEELLLARQPFRPYSPKKELNIGYGIIEPPLFTNGMQQAFFLKCPMQEGSRYLLFLSRVHEKKGIDLLLTAYETLLEKEKESERKVDNLVIAGPGLETPYGILITELVNHSPLLKGRVFFTGMLTGDEKWGAFYGCEAFILPSHQENFGIAVVEALACTRPVLISNQINIWREIAAGKGGIVAEDTEQGVLSLLEEWQAFSAKEKEIMGVAARNVYEEYFAIGPAAKKFANMIDKL